MCNSLVRFCCCEGSEFNLTRFALLLNETYRVNKVLVNGRFHGDASTTSIFDVEFTEYLVFYFVVVAGACGGRGGRSARTNWTLWTRPTEYH